MYQIALSVSPDQMEVIATMLYAEMLKHGYTQVAEFHYLHHDVNGKYYNNLAEMGQRLVSAAHKSGIKLALIPIFYKNGGFGEEPSEQQRRFISTSVSDYLKLWEASQEATNGFDNASVGIGFHSLRAVDELSIKEVLSDLPDGLPVHIHVAEQLKEVEEAIQFFGKRPVRWMLDNLELNNRFNLVHATHLDENEVRDLALSHSNVVLCPSTEGNLGDGIFSPRGESADQLHHQDAAHHQDRDVHDPEARRCGTGQPVVEREAQVGDRTRGRRIEERASQPIEPQAVPAHPRVVDDAGVVVQVEGCSEHPAVGDDRDPDGAERSESSEDATIDGAQNRISNRGGSGSPVGRSSIDRPVRSVPPVRENTPGTARRTSGRTPRGR